MNAQYGKGRTPAGCWALAMGARSHWYSGLESSAPAVPIAHGEFCPLVLMTLKPSGIVPHRPSLPGSNAAADKLHARAEEQRVMRLKAVQRLVQRCMQHRTWCKATAGGIQELGPMITI